MDCGVACIAMIANQPYERILSSVPNDVFFHGLWYMEIVHALIKITEKSWGYFDYPSTEVKDFSVNVNPLILVLLRPNDTIHYVVWDGITIFDPLDNVPSHVNHSKYEGWKITGFFARR